MQPGNASKARPSHLTTANMVNKVSPKDLPSKDVDPELGHSDSDTAWQFSETWTRMAESATNNERNYNKRQIQNANTLTVCVCVCVCVCMHVCVFLKYLCRDWPESINMAAAWFKGVQRRICSGYNDTVNKLFHKSFTNSAQHCPPEPPHSRAHQSQSLQSSPPRHTLRNKRIYTCGCASWTGI